MMIFHFWFVGVEKSLAIFFFQTDHLPFKPRDFVFGGKNVAIFRVIKIFNFGVPKTGEEKK